MNWKISFDRALGLQTLSRLRAEGSKSNILPMEPKETLEKNDERAIDLFLEQGGFLLVGLEGFFGYTIIKHTKEPKEDFGYVYIAAISRSQRGTKLFIEGVVELGRILQNRGVRKVRFRAKKGNIYNNNLYRKIATALREEPNEEGIPSVLYEADISTILKKYEEYIS